MKDLLQSAINILNKRYFINENNIKSIKPVVLKEFSDLPNHFNVGNSIIEEIKINEIDLYIFIDLLNLTQYVKECCLDSISYKKDNKLVIIKNLKSDDFFWVSTELKKILIDHENKKLTKYILENVYNYEVKKVFEHYNIINKRAIKKIKKQYFDTDQNLLMEVISLLNLSQYDKEIINNMVYFKKNYKLYFVHNLITCDFSVDNHLLCSILKPENNMEYKNCIKLYFKILIKSNNIKINKILPSISSKMKLNVCKTITKIKGNSELEKYLII